MKFLCPIGAVRDVKELEYLVALHQTAHDDFVAFADGSVETGDVKAFLMSRYGIDVSEDEVRDIIFSGLAGGEAEKDPKLDIFEIVAILIIPLLVKINDTLTGRRHRSAAQAENERWLQPSPEIIADVLQILLRDTLRGAYNPAAPPPLTAALVKAMLAEHDELDTLKNDRLVDNMVRAATAGAEGGVVVLDVATFARALTNDVDLYDVRNETTCSTIFSDVFNSPGVVTQQGGGDEIFADRPSLTARLSDAVATVLQPAVYVPAPEGGGGEGAAGKRDRATAAAYDPAPADVRAPRDSKGARSIGVQDLLGTEGVAQRGAMKEDDRDAEAPSSASSEEGESLPLTRTEDDRIRRFSMLSQIDFTADNVQSWQYSVLVWVVIVYSYLFYQLDLDIDYNVCKKEPEELGPWLGCTVGNAIVSWLIIMLRLTLLGSVMGIGLSMGNQGYRVNAKAPILGLIAIVIFIFLPFSYPADNYLYKTNGDTLAPLQQGSKKTQPEYVLILLGVVLALNQIIKFVSFHIKLDSLSPRVRGLFLGSNGRAEFRSKQAGIYKVNKMVEHAYALHKTATKAAKNRKAMKAKASVSFSSTNDKEKSTRDRALENYTDNLDATEEVGGILWAFKSIFTGHLQKTEGIWLSTRLMAALGIMSITIIVGTAYSIGNYEAAVDYIQNATAVDYTSLQVDTKDLAIQAAGFSPPSERLLRNTLQLAIATGSVVATGTTLVYIPSSIHTMLKFRSGVLGSLHDPGFISYRTNLQDMSYLIGAMFYGLVISTVFTVGIVAGAYFVLFWPVTQRYVLRFMAQGIGIACTIVLKIGFCAIFMKFTFAGYYRTKPVAANIFSFALESWYLALTIGLILSRTIKFVICTGLYVGRIDRPALAEGLLIDLDILPKTFYKTLLSTDAHRHPYIEILGRMYLMKLHFKRDFGSASGSAWRLLFVSALMPWLKKKRIQDAFTPCGDGEERLTID